MESLGWLVFGRGRYEGLPPVGFPLESRLQPVLAAEKTG
jgi:hypothetical protein